MKVLFGAMAALCLMSCASSETQVKEALQKNPDLVFDVIAKNPEKFIEVVNKAAQQAQRAQYEKQVKEAREEQEHDLQNPKKPQISDRRKLVGSSDAPITIVEFADFQCPACGMAYGSLEQFMRKHAGQVRYYYKDMPLDFHPMAMPSALAFEAVRRQGEDKGHRFYESLFKNQKSLTPEYLKKAAREAGVDMNKYNKDVASMDVKDQIQKDMQEFESFGFTGTPVVILNGVAMRGAPSVEELERVLAMTRKN